MKTVGLIPSQVLASLSQDEQGAWLGVPEGQTVVPLVKTAPPSFNAETEKLVPAEPEWFADRVERRFSVVALTAEELDHRSRNAKRVTLGQAIPTLRAWSDDAENAVAAWDGQTTAQRFAVTKIALTRLGIFFDRFADLLEAQRIDK